MCYLFLKSNTHIPNTFLCFSNTEICYLSHDTKHVFQQHFLNYSFHIILNNKFWTPWPNGLLMVQARYSLLIKLNFFFFFFCTGNFQQSEDDSITMFVPTYKEHLVSSSIMRNDNRVLKKYSTPCACTNKRLSCSIALHKRQQNIVQHSIQCCHKSQYDEFKKYENIHNNYYDWSSSF